MPKRLVAEDLDDVDICRIRIEIPSRASCPAQRREGHLSCQSWSGEHGSAWRRKCAAVDKVPDYLADSANSGDMTMGRGN